MAVVDSLREGGIERTADREERERPIKRDLQREEQIDRDKDEGERE